MGDKGKCITKTAFIYNWSIRWISVRDKWKYLYLFIIQLHGSWELMDPLEVHRPQVKNSCLVFKTIVGFLFPLSILHIPYYLQRNFF